jgi:hypothetical protein
LSKNQSIHILLHAATLYFAKQKGFQSELCAFFAACASKAIKNSAPLNNRTVDLAACRAYHVRFGFFVAKIMLKENVDESILIPGAAILCAQKEPQYFCHCLFKPPEIYNCQIRATVFDVNMVLL